MTDPTGTTLPEVPTASCGRASRADDRMLCCPRRRCRITQRISLLLPDNSLGCVWFAGTQEGVPDISVWFSALAPGSDQWSTPVQLSDDPSRSEQNPILHVVDDRCVWLLWTSQHAGNQDTARVLRRISTDGGRTWGPTHTLIPETDAGGVFVRQPITVLPSGRLLLPVFHCVRVPGRKWVGDRDYSGVLISDDGETWREVLVPDSIGCVHMNIGRLSNGIVGRAVPQPVGGPYLPKCVLRRRRDVVGSSRHRTAEQQLVDPVRGAAR